MIRPIRDLHPHLPDRVEIIDNTLRDGEQAPGVWFNLEEKIELACALSRAGVNVLDAGFPVGSESDMEAMQEMHRCQLEARIAATARPLESDVIAAEKAHADEIFLFMPMSDLRIQQTLGITRERATAIFRAGAEAVVARGMTLNLVFEDATRAPTDALIRTVETLRQHVPIERLILCDTVGVGHPTVLHALIRKIDEAFSGEIALCPHCHNDFGLATANTMAAVSAGARALTCTVNGIGERAGNADFAECVAALTHIYEVEHRIDALQIGPLSRMVERMSGIHTSATKPVTGFNVFRHESGVHVDSMIKDRRSYEPFPPAWVGGETEYVLGKHSGTSLVRHLLEQAGIEENEERVRDLLRQVKAFTEARDKSEHRSALETKEDFTARALAGVDPGLLIERRGKRRARLAK